MGLTLYQRDHCHLCDLALDELAKARAPEFESVFIDGDDALEERYGLRVPVLSCEVFLEPRDDVSVLFHGTYGFQEVGQQIMPGLSRRVSLLAKQLPSYEFVRSTYLEGPTGQLPNQPWLAQRKRSGPPTPRRAAGGL